MSLFSYFSSFSRQIVTWCWQSNPQAETPPRNRQKSSTAARSPCLRNHSCSLSVTLTISSLWRHFSSRTSWKGNGYSVVMSNWVATLIMSQEINNGCKHCHKRVYKPPAGMSSNRVSAIMTSLLWRHYNDVIYDVIITVWYLWRHLQKNYFVQRRHHWLIHSSHDVTMEHDLGNRSY